MDTTNVMERFIVVILVNLQGCGIKVGRTMLEGTHNLLIISKRTEAILLVI